MPSQPTVLAQAFKALLFGYISTGDFAIAIDAIVRINPFLWRQGHQSYKPRGPGSSDRFSQGQKISGRSNQLSLRPSRRNQKRIAPSITRSSITRSVSNGIKPHARKASLPLDQAKC